MSSGPTIERWEKLDPEERLKMVKGRNNGNNKNLNKNLAPPPPQNDIEEMASKSRSTKRIESGISIEANMRMQA